MKGSLGFVWAAAVTVAACATGPLPGSLQRDGPELPPGDALSARVALVPERRELEIVAGPFDVPAMAGSHHAHDHGAPGMYSPMVVFPWPVEGGLVGFRLEAISGDGTPRDRDIFHHVIGLNFDRRQLVYPVTERLFGFGTETPDIELPGSLEMPVARGDSIGFYAMWNNTTGAPLHDVYMRVVLSYAGPDEVREPALPLYVDTNNHIGGKTSFDLPPGRSLHSYEFELPVGGSLLAASGHLHDYGRELRIEEARSGRVLTRLRPETDREGHVLAVEQKIYRRFFKLIDARIPLAAGVRYRVVGEYENPTGVEIPDGGMAHVVGLFVPDRPEAWPALDPTDASYRLDRGALPPRLEIVTGREHEPHGGPGR